MGELIEEEDNRILTVEEQKAELLSDVQANIHKKQDEVKEDKFLYKNNCSDVCHGLHLASQIVDKEIERLFKTGKIKVDLP